MKSVEVVKSRSVRVNLGNYESTDFFVSVKAEVDDDETRSSVARSLRKTVDASLIEDISAHFIARGKTLSKNAIAKKYGFKTE